MCLAPQGPAKGSSLSHRFSRLALLSVLDYPTGNLADTPRLKLAERSFRLSNRLGGRVLCGSGPFLKTMASQSKTGEA
jgi:hypothetical protein